MRPRPRSRPLATLAVCAALLVACSDEPAADRAVPIVEPEMPAADREVCRALVADLPETLFDQQRRQVEPEGALGAAYGAPPITVRCGVAEPDGYDRFAICEEVDGVGWFVPLEEAEDQGRDVTWTSAGYRPRVEIVLPAAYRPEGAAAVIAQLADVVAEHTRLVRPCR